MQEMFRYPTVLLTLLIVISGLGAQEVPGVHSHMGFEADRLFIEKPRGERVYARDDEPRYTLQSLKGHPAGADEGILFDFKDRSLQGTLYYGFVNYEDARFAQPVFFKRTSPIEDGHASIKIRDNLSGKYDMIGWQASGKGTIGYRVVDKTGQFLYEGRIRFKDQGDEGFEIDDTIVEGPFVGRVQPDGATIWFETNRETGAYIEINGKQYGSREKSSSHEITIEGLRSDQRYRYTVVYGQNRRTYDFKTAPEPGSRKQFVFAYASDSRSGQGGGERDMYGANFYIMKRIFALNMQQNAAFIQFSGDLINGYLNNIQETRLQYANWKRAVEPFAPYLPIYVSMGNHEALIHSFKDDEGRRYSVDKFPYAKYSAEAIFAENFANPVNGPQSEDGADYDPDPNTMDFPSYDENVFYYTYDNVAVITLNSNYWYAPGVLGHPYTGGNIHAYIMDQQLAWFKKMLDQLERDEAIDHIFVTLHTPFFPNGGHVSDDMWYGGDNKPRAYVNGKGLPKGIIERRDQLLQAMVNENSKVVAILTGDEHNYNRLKISPQMPMYPEDYREEKIELSRTIWQINNGAAGAPYYAQEKTPWSQHVTGFTTQNAVVYFHVHGDDIRVDVINPDTLEPVDQFTLR